jgi:hypothetical protein
VAVRDLRGAPRLLNHIELLLQISEVSHQLDNLVDRFGALFCACPVTSVNVQQARQAADWQKNIDQMRLRLAQSEGRFHLNLARLVLEAEMVTNGVLTPGRKKK